MIYCVNGIAGGTRGNFKGPAAGVIKKSNSLKHFVLVPDINFEFPEFLVRSPKESTEVVDL